MTEKPIKNLAASIRQKLTNYANETGRPFQEVLQYFAMERFLYRLSRSPHTEQFVLKRGVLKEVTPAIGSNRPRSNRR
jgi:hypothetical protein